ncbi:MAG: hypothetical protein ACRD6X_05160 [Pyrinomonadaceae bacterium]
MLALVSSLLFFLSESASTGAASTGTWASIREYWDVYLNYPGFEIWKFLNLGIFVGLLYYIAKKKKVSEVFKARREEIRAEIIKAEEEKKAALEQLTKAEAKLVGVDAEKDAVMKSARTEIDEEKKRLAAQAEAEAAKLLTQANGEIVRLGQVAKLGLRRFAVDESLRMAEEKLTAAIDPTTDARLIKSGINAIGGLN